MLGPSSKLNIHSVGHWWTLNQLEMPGRWSSVCIVLHVNVADRWFMVIGDRPQVCGVYNVLS
jgi:hypothetical protein